jgi:hypothetical protein
MLDLSYIIPDMTNTEINTRTEERKNQIQGEVCYVTKEEAKIHDDCSINELAATLEDKAAGFGGASKLWDKYTSRHRMVYKNNAKAYMVLLD